MAGPGRKGSVAMGVLVAGIMVFVVGTGASTVRSLIDGQAGRGGVTRPAGGDDGDGKGGKPKPETPDAYGTPILDYYADDEGVAKLVDDMAAGKMPQRVGLLYDQMGANPTLELVDDPTIAMVYQIVSTMTIHEDVPATPVTDSYHKVYFVLQDGTTVGWSFEGAGTVLRGGEALTVEGDDELWSLARSLYGGMGQDGQGGGQAPAGTCSISLVDAGGIVRSCPTSARPGETVTIDICEMTDVYPVVTSRDGDLEIRQKGGWDFEFEMPDHDVTLVATVTTAGLGGA